MKEVQNCRICSYISYCSRPMKCIKDDVMWDKSRKPLQWHSFTDFTQTATKQLVFRLLVQCRSLPGVPLPPDDGVLPQRAITTEEREINNNLSFGAFLQ